MISIEAKLEDADKTRILNALNKVASAVDFYSTEAPRKLALAFVQELRANIISGKYDSAFAAYNPRYAEWKRKYSPSQKFWVLFGDLVMALRVFKDSTSGYWGGVPYGVLDRGGKSWLGQGRAGQGKRKEIAMYGSIVEEGNRKTPSRPLFALTYRDFTWSKSLTTAGKMWNVGEEVLRLIGGQWK